MACFGHLGSLKAKTYSHTDPKYSLRIIAQLFLFIPPVVMDDLAALLLTIGF